MNTNRGARHGTRGRHARGGRADWRWRTIVVATPKGREVLVRPVAAGLCHSDLLFLDGLWPHPVPTILGHEVAGVVEAIGPEVTSVAVGDHVLGCAGGGCHECRYCVMGRPIICTNREPRPLARRRATAAARRRHADPPVRAARARSPS